MFNLFKKKKKEQVIIPDKYYNYTFFIRLLSGESYMFQQSIKAALLDSVTSDSKSKETVILSDLMQLRYFIVREDGKEVCIPSRQVKSIKLESCKLV